MFKTLTKTLHISKYEAVLLTEVHLEAYQIIQLSAKLNINYKLAVNNKKRYRKKNPFFFFKSTGWATKNYGEGDWNCRNSCVIKSFKVYLCRQVEIRLLYSRLISSISTLWNSNKVSKSQDYHRKGQTQVHMHIGGQDGHGGEVSLFYQLQIPFRNHYQTKLIRNTSLAVNRS